MRMEEFSSEHGTGNFGRRRGLLIRPQQLNDAQLGRFP
jgi:hypothetical protein